MIPATSHLLGSTKKSRKSDHCHTFAISARNSFVAPFTKTADLQSVRRTFLRLMGTPFMINLVAA